MHNNLVGTKLNGNLKLHRLDQVVEEDMTFKSKIVSYPLSEIIDNQKIIIFGLPGAFTPTCSKSHLPMFEELYNIFTMDLGIDEIYCTAVNDPYVMDKWFSSKEIDLVEPMPDGNGTFAESINQLVSKLWLGFGKRSWRYSMVVDNGVITHFLGEDRESTEEDPFKVSKAEHLLELLRKEVVKE